eukprot:16293799-Heterocapsa_arctica.AAC.1
MVSLPLLLLPPLRLFGLLSWCFLHLHECDVHCRPVFDSVAVQPVLVALRVQHYIPEDFWGHFHACICLYPSENEGMRNPPFEAAQLHPEPVSWAPCILPVAMVSIRQRVVHLLLCFLLLPAVFLFSE